MQRNKSYFIFIYPSNRHFEILERKYALFNSKIMIVSYENNFSISLKSISREHSFFIKYNEKIHILIKKKFYNEEYDPEIDIHHVPLKK